ncbi:ROK family transcriptional regulator [Cryobacterium tagatosivorans]|uniref:ROK family transcriptional regulator n=1 Tax=Cryobacterium tagatosivorans TaxID=1259199 RepID=A0A4R8UFW4_9MICO|nr:ROK family transcriptional regulator [Cryobacterium tagatosivorans]TFB52316.1 ROK family transcriptional regulator [Cryobacterium tagatosivorans]
MVLLEAVEPRFRAPSSELAREVLIHGPILRSDLASRLGLSLATLTRLTRPLLDRGLLMELPEELDGGMGRPAKPLDVRADAGQFIGIKLTGDAAFAVTTDLKAAEGRRAERPLPSHDVADVVDVIADLVRELANHQDVLAIGISVGGVVSNQRVVERASFLGWSSVRLADHVEEKLGIPVIVENDVVALTAAEHWFGLGRGLSNFAVITIGAGVGYGLVMYDHVVSTADTGRGRGFHFPLDAAGPLCPVGHRGCSTAMLTIPSIRAQVEVALGAPATYAEILRMAREDNPVARQVVHAAGAALGHLIAAVANLAMVEHVVLGGEGLGVLSIAGDDMRAAIRADRDPEAAEITLLIDEDGFISWARAAAAIAIQRTLDTLATTP